MQMQHSVCSEVRKVLYRNERTEGANELEKIVCPSRGTAEREERMGVWFGLDGKKFRRCFEPVHFLPRSFGLSNMVAKRTLLLLVAVACCVAAALAVFDATDMHALHRISDYVVTNDGAVFVQAEYVRLL